MHDKFEQIFRDCILRPIRTIFHNFHANIGVNALGLRDVLDDEAFQSTKLSVRSLVYRGRFIAIIGIAEFLEEFSLACVAEIALDDSILGDGIMTR